jgi:hypothetical protein
MRRRRGGHNIPAEGNDEVQASADGHGEGAADIHALDRRALQVVVDVEQRRGAAEGREENGDRLVLDSIGNEQGRETVTMSINSLRCLPLINPLQGNDFRRCEHVLQRDQANELEAMGLSRDSWNAKKR